MSQPPEAKESPDLRDLLRAAVARHRPVPLLLAVTILVETLNICIAAQRRGHIYRRLSLERIVLGGAPPEALLEDPTRDPKIEIPAPTEPGTAIDLRSIGAVFFELITGTPPGGAPGCQGRHLDPLLNSPAVESLLDDLLPAERGEPASAERALARARTLGLDLLGTWERQRRHRRLESDLRTALEDRHEPRVRELVTELAASDPESDWARRADLWLQVRSRRQRAADEARRRLRQALLEDLHPEVEIWGAQLRRILGPEAVRDADLNLARTWLEREKNEQALRQEEKRRTSIKLILTGAPLIVATMLTGLLAAVMLFSV